MSLSDDELAYCDKLIARWAEERKQRSTFNAATEAMDYFDHLVAEVRELRHQLSCLLDKPEDRLWHAEDGTWWKLVDGRLVAADKEE